MCVFPNLKARLLPHHSLPEYLVLKHLYFPFQDDHKPL